MFFMLANTWADTCIHREQTASYLHVYEDVKHHFPFSCTYLQRCRHGGDISNSSSKNKLFSRTAALSDVWTLSERTQHVDKDIHSCLVGRKTKRRRHKDVESQEWKKSLKVHKDTHNYSHNCMQLTSVNSSNTELHSLAVLLGAPS